MNINGLFIVNNFITPEEEKSLLDFIYHQPWNTELSRRTQHYGYKYVYSNRSLSAAPPIPEWLESLGERIQTHYALPVPFDQIIVNEYEPGQGIAAHTDHKVHFGPVVVSLSLRSAVDMQFSGNGVDETIRLKPRTLLLMKDYARNVLRHEIKERGFDIVGGHRIPRSTRVSITFRTVNK